MSKIEELALKAKNGDSGAFDMLYKETNKGVWFTCISLLKNQNA